MREPGRTESGETSTLVVEGGGLRGAFGAGVLSELHAHGAARFDDVVAVSSGAPTAAYLAAGQPADGLRIWEDHTHGAQLISPKNWLRASPLMDIDRLVDVFDRGVPLDVGRLQAARCHVVVTNCETGRAEYVRATPSNALALLKATMAIPVAYGKVVHVDGVPYIDGGVADAIPVRHALTLGARCTVVVLTRPRGYRRKRSRAGAFLMARTYARYPAVGRALAARWRTSNDSLDLVDELEKKGEVSVIRPEVALAASRLSTRREDILATIEAGRTAARRWLAAR